MKSEPGPILKWVGGKTQLLQTILASLPPNINTYYEPFFGGGALFFALARREAFQTAVINDTNRELMDVYRVVRDFPEDLCSQLEKLKYDKDVFETLKSYDTSTFSPIRRAARTIYLNKCCFNGLFRVNKAGKFNVGFGKFAKDPKTFNRETILADSEVLNTFVKILSVDFEESLMSVQAGDFVYLDPPYVPLNATSNFTAYTKEDFGPKSQERLASVFRDLADSGVMVMASNSNTPIVRVLYEGFNITEVNARRSVNSKAEKRGEIKELLITNYEVTPNANI